MFKYTEILVQLLEGRDGFSLPIHLQSKYQTIYNHTLYGTWSYSLHMPNVVIEFSYYANNYLISKSKIDAANLG